MTQSYAMGIFGIVAVASCWILAIVLYRVGAAGSVSRKLSLVLVFEGFALGTAGYVELLFNPVLDFDSQYPDLALANGIIHTLADCAMLALYPHFLAAALQTKLPRLFANNRVRIGLAAYSMALFFFVNLGPPRPAWVLLLLSLSLLFAFALIASVHAWRVAAPGIDRTRARIFALAFGIRDICWLFIYAHGITLIARNIEDAPEPEFFYIIYAAGTFFAVPLIAYGILRTQLFDIDLRIRWTIKQSTLAAAIVVIMFVLSEGAERLLSADLGNVGSLIVAALVVFALTPLQRFAERVASMAMPNTGNTPEYAASRKLQVYEAALAEALPDGNVSERERELLNRLRDSLGISISDADAVEREFRERPSSFA